MARPASGISNTKCLSSGCSSCGFEIFLICIPLIKTCVYQLLEVVLGDNVGNQQIGRNYLNVVVVGLSIKSSLCRKRICKAWCGP